MPLKLGSQDVTLKLGTQDVTAYLGAEQVSALDPTSIEGLFGWYDASVASSVTVQTGVQSWGDLAGSMGPAIQNTTNDQPAYGSVTLNGKATITFDGTDDFLRSGTFSLPQPYMMFAVYRFEAAYVSAVRAMEMGDGSSRSGELIRTAADIQQLFCGTGITFGDYPVGGLQTFGVHDVEVNGAASMLRYNGTDAGAAQNAGTNGANQLTLGANRFGTGLGNVSFAELVVYNRILSASEAASVRQYLTGKWGT
jgi:hypothetical protein